jgi:ParB family transcriptional regulator, chromosome partitioning protein
MTSNTKKRGALGKGLSALLENAATDITSKSQESGVVGSISMIPIGDIEANPFNPRTNFEKEALEELRESIATHGIIQPLTVRKLGRDKYQLISGERRFRASQLNGLEEVPAYIRVANDQAMLEMALVENIQREDLNSIEVALSYQRLITECNLTQEQLSQKISKSRSSITNHIRLLKLPAIIQLGVRDGLISMGHARALVSAGEEQFQVFLYQRIIDHNLSVRDLEVLIREGYKAEEISDSSKEKAPSPALNKAQETFRSFLGDRVSAKVDIKKNNLGSGKIMISFNSEVDLNRIIEILNK